MIELSQVIEGIIASIGVLFLITYKYNFFNKNKKLKSAGIIASLWFVIWVFRKIASNAISNI